MLNDTDKTAFGYIDDKPNLLTEHGIEDPYQSLYKALPDVIKQSLNVNSNRAEEFAQPEDYLNYNLTATSQPKTEVATAADKKAANESKSLCRNLEVCLSELWLKWVISAKADNGPPASSSLPFLAHLSDEWGFITEDLLLYFERGNIQFADLTTPVGKNILKERFTAWSEIKKQFMIRTHKSAEKADIALRTSHFVLISREVMEIERTSIMAMPNWPIIKAIKAEDPTKSVRTKQAIGVYAGGVWYSPQTNRYVVSGTESSAGKEAKGHHIYQVHPYSIVEPEHLSTLISLLTVTFVRKNRFTVWPYPFDLIRLHQELNASTNSSYN